MLHETCMLVKISVNLPPQTKIARRASEKVEQEYQTAKKQGRVTKSLFSAKDMSPLTKAVSALRAKFHELSLPYDGVYRILPTKTYFDFVQGLKPYSDSFDDAKVEFIRKYPEVRSRAALALGSLYDPADYPTEQELDNIMNLSIETSVIPNVTAFDELAGLTPEAVEELKKQAAEGQKAKVEEAIQDLFKRLFKSLKKASVRLADEDGIFRKSLMDNVDNALDAIDSLNLTDNQELIDLAQEVREMIADVQPEDLRRDKELRKKTAEETQAVLDKISEFF